VGSRLPHRRRQGATEAPVEQIDGITFFRTTPPAPTRSPIAELREIGALRGRLDQVIEEWRPDHIHAHSRC
jgi:hypothetical protein